MVRMTRFYRVDDGEDLEGGIGDGVHDEPTIIVNGEEVPVSQAQDKLNEMAHNLKSGYDKVLAKDRERLREEIGGALEKDLEWFETHDQKEWGSYELTSKGGRGYVGAGEPKSVERKDVQSNKEAVATLVSSDVRALHSRIESLETRLVERDAVQVVDTMKAYMAKYPYADSDAVLLKLQSIHRETGRPATNAEILQVVQKSHDHVELQISRTRKADPTGKEEKSPIPIVGGKPPETEKTKRPRLGTDEFVQYVSSKGFNS